MTTVFFTMHQAALMALIPKGGAMTEEALATATTYPPRVVREQLQGLVAGGWLVRDAAGQYRHPEKTHA